MADVYPGLDDLEDVAWIRDATSRGWVLLTKDKAIRRNRREHEAAQRTCARMFCIANGTLTGEQMARRFIANEGPIIRKCGTPGPYIWSVLANRLAQIYPRSPPSR